MSENILDRIKLLMKYDLKETYEENKRRIIKENVSPGEASEMAKNVWSLMDGDVETQDLNSILDIINKNILGKNYQDGTCLLSKVISYYKSYSNKSFSLSGDLLKDIKNSEESGEPEFEDIKQDLINLIQTELDGFCNTASSQQQTTTPDSGARQKNITNIYCSVVNNIITANSQHYKNKPWSQYAKDWEVTDNEIQTAKKTCPDVRIGGEKENKVRQVPPELRNVDGVKLFQSWLDQNHAGWHDKYNVLGDDVNKGWGIYGPRTEKAWTNYKDDYLKWINDGGSFEKLKSQDTIKTGSETEYKYKPPINFPEKLTFDNSNSILNKKNLTP